jgi:hypothetical protein
MKLLKMSDIPERKIFWPWYGYIPGGKVTNISGMWNVGKTHLAMAIIAAVTGGHTLPGQESPNEPMRVLLQTPKNRLSDVVKPRLAKSGANCDLIYVTPSELECESSDVEILEDLINEIGAKLFVVDPLDLYLHNTGEEGYFSCVRRFSDLAASTGCAVVLVGDELPPSAEELVHSLILVGVEDGEDDFLRSLSHMTPILGGNIGEYSEDVLFRIHPEEGFQWVDLKSEALALQ